MQFCIHERGDDTFRNDGHTEPGGRQLYRRDAARYLYDFLKKAVFIDTFYKSTPNQIVRTEMENVRNIEEIVRRWYDEDTKRKEGRSHVNHGYGIKE